MANVRTDLLLLLADKLEAMPDERFDMNRYFTDCGTPSCALGWATTIPEWNQFGLDREWSLDCIGVFRPVFAGKASYAIPIGEALGLDIKELGYIFYGRHGREEEIRRLREIAAKYAPPAKPSQWNQEQSRRLMKSLDSVSNNLQSILS